MNRFRIKSGFDQEFADMWRNRESMLADYEGFKSFHLLKGAAVDGVTLYVTHTVWANKEAFDQWFASDEFQMASTGRRPSVEMFDGPSSFEGFELLY